jgi:HAD superfamily 5'-nucleotidase-like hydrolase
VKKRIYCNRTLNMRSIKAIGYDMDYTLVHYRVEDWERRAYEYMKRHFLEAGWPVDALEFEPNRVARGLIIDRDKGNLIKANRFGFIKKAMHGTQDMDFEGQRETYSRTIVDLHDRRWVFLNTLFSLSEGCMYAQLVDLLDRREVPEVLGYGQLYDRVRNVIDTAHMEGRLKADIMANPDQFVDLDPEIALALLDQKHAGKKLLLITNSEWAYTCFMMKHTIDRFLPEGMTWRNLFDIVIVGARKPEFFSTRSPFFEVATEDGLLKTMTSYGLKSGTAYLGGSAQQVEKHLGISGDEILYVGDHMFGDVHASKSVLRWRTALILRELEDELEAQSSFEPDEAKLEVLMEEKALIEAELCQLRLGVQRARDKYAAIPEGQTAATLQKQFDDKRAELLKLDDSLGPLARQSASINNPLWGLLMRTGNDKSLLAFQLERYADIYTSRVSNFLHSTPFAFLRSPRGTLPHDK